MAENKSKTHSAGEKVCILVVDDRTDKLLAYEVMLVELNQEIVCARLRRAGEARGAAVPVARNGVRAGKARPLVDYVFPALLPVHDNDRGYRIS